MPARASMPLPAALLLWLALGAGQALCDPQRSVFLLDLEAAATCGPDAWRATRSWGLHSRWRGAAARDRQRLPDACGPAALSAVLRLRGVAVRQELLWSVCRLQDGGTSLERLAWAARRFGSNCEARSFADLREVPLPAVVHLRRRHFVVVRYLDARLAEIFDPDCGDVAVPAAELLRQASGATLIFAGDGARPAAATARAADLDSRGGLCR